jgi:hypothetical protein
MPFKRRFKLSIRDSWLFKIIAFFTEHLAQKNTSSYINPMIAPNTIDEVITQLDNIIEWSKQKQSRIGYFATLYRKMTIAVKEGITNNSFEDGKRMELVDCIFAKRYFDAFEAYISKRKCTNAWCTTFDACNRNDLVVLQHIILGVNTHINLDLGIATAEACPGDKIYDLQTDFEKINDIIASIVQNVEDSLCKVWFPLTALSKIMNNREKGILNFSVEKARKAAWANALALSVASGPAKDNYINMIDKTVTTLANRIINPGYAATFILKPVLNMETTSVPAIIDMLKK